jgi:UDP-N-acetylglucosamine 4-epimerase
VYGDGTNSRDFCFVENVVRANLLAATAPLHDQWPRVFNIACGERTTLLELFDALRNEVARYRPEALNAVLQHAAPRRGDVAHSRANITLAQAWLGYEPAYSLSRGLRETMAGYRWPLVRAEAVASAAEDRGECSA